MKRVRVYRFIGFIFSLEQHINNNYNAQVVFHALAIVSMNFVFFFLSEGCFCYFKVRIMF